MYMCVCIYVYLFLHSIVSFSTLDGTAPQEEVKLVR